MKSFQWSQAATIDQAVSTLDPKAGDGVAEPRKVHLKAGGVDLMDLCKEHLASPDHVVNIRNIAGLNKIEDDGHGGLKIGPLVTLAQLSENPKAREKFPILCEAVGQAANPQIRNMATIGGNLLQRPRCWYFRHEDFPCRKKGGERCFAQDGENQYHAIFDNWLCAIVHPSASATPLMALGANFKLKSPSAERVVPAEKFFVLPKDGLHHENVLAPDEMLTEIQLPAPAANTKSAYVRQGEKQYDWPIAEVAVLLEMDGDTCTKPSIVLGAAAPAPHRAIEAEKALKGQKITEELARHAAKSALRDARPLQMNEYKVPLFENLIRRTVLAAASANGGK